VRDVFCYDIGIIGDFPFRIGVYAKRFRGCYMLSLSMVLVYRVNVFIS
jgi:hypothetical protein